MYFNGTETEELCTKLDAELSRGMSTDSSLCRFQRDAKKNVVVKKAAAVGVPARESLKTGNGMIRFRRFELKSCRNGKKAS